MKDHFSSDEEFDRPIREYLEKTMARPQKKTDIRCTSTGTTAFAHEMDDELDQIYQNFLSRGTFQLPLASKSYLSSLSLMERAAAPFPPSSSENTRRDEATSDGGCRRKRK